MKNNIEENIMNQIRGGKVKLRSKYLFLAEKVGSVGGFIFSLLFSIFLINLVLFYMKTTDNLEYLSFGRNGILAFLESFPSIFFLGGIIFTFAAGYFMAKNDISYKHPFVYMVFCLIAIVVLSSGVLASSGINDKFEEISQSNKKASIVLKPFFNKNINDRNRGIIGRVIEISSDSIKLRTINNEVMLALDRVKKSAIKDFFKLDIQEGDFIVAIGRGIEGEFMVFDIKEAENNRISLIRQRILNNQINDKCDFNRDERIDNSERIRCNIIINDMKKKCGDGVCDEREKDGGTICSKDCASSQD